MGNEKVLLHKEQMAFLKAKKIKSSMPLASWLAFFKPLAVIDEAGDVRRQRMITGGGIGVGAAALSNIAYMEDSSFALVSICLALALTMFGMVARYRNRLSLRKDLHNNMRNCFVPFLAAIPDLDPEKELFFKLDFSPFHEQDEALRALKASGLDYGSFNFTFPWLDGNLPLPGDATLHLQIKDHGKVHVTKMVNIDGENFTSDEPRFSWEFEREILLAGRFSEVNYDMESHLGVTRENGMFCLEDRYVFSGGEPQEYFDLPLIGVDQAGMLLERIAQMRSRMSLRS